MSSRSNWLLGEIRLATSATIVCNASNIVIAAGSYYLDDANGSLGLVSILSAGIGAIVAGGSAYLCRDRKIRLDGNGGALTMTFPAALQAALGFAGSPTPAALVVASSVSTLLWSPSWRGKPLEHPLGIEGLPVDDVVQTASPTGAKIRTTVHHTQTVTGWSWDAVPQERVWTTSAGLGGEFAAFRTAVIRLGRRFKFYDPVDEDDSSASSVSLPTALGPYIADATDQNWFKRMVATLDTWATIELRNVVKTGEIA